MAYSLLGYELSFCKISPGQFFMSQLSYITIRLPIVYHTLTTSTLIPTLVLLKSSKVQSSVEKLGESTSDDR